MERLLRITAQAAWTMKIQTRIISLGMMTGDINDAQKKVAHLLDEAISKAKQSPYSVCELFDYSYEKEHKKVAMGSKA